MNAGDIAISLILQVVLIALNAVFACAEIAVVSANKTKMEKLSEDGNRRARRIVRLTQNPSRFLSTIQVAITLASLLGSAFAADNFAEPLAQAIIDAGLAMSFEVLETICLILITLVLSYFSIVFGELVPKRIAMKNPEKVSCGLSGILRFVSVLFAPLVWLLTASSNGILRLFGIKPEDRGRGRHRRGDHAHGGGGQREGLHRREGERVHPEHLRLQGERRRRSVHAPEGCRLPLRARRSLRLGRDHQKELSYLLPRLRQGHRRRDGRAQYENLLPPRR